MILIPSAIIAGFMFAGIVIYCIEKDVPTSIIITISSIYVTAMVTYSYLVYQSIG